MINLYASLCKILHSFAAVKSCKRQDPQPKAWTVLDIHQCQGNAVIWAMQWMQSSGWAQMKPATCAHLLEYLRNAVKSESLFQSFDSLHQSRRVVLWNNTPEPTTCLLCGTQISPFWGTFEEQFKNSSVLSFFPWRGYSYKISAWDLLYPCLSPTLGLWNLSF